MLARELNVAAAACVERSDDCHDEYMKGHNLQLQSNMVMWMRWQGMGACWLHCRGPTHHVSLWNAGFGSCSGL